MNKTNISKFLSGEIFFALFLVAGYFKADHRFMFIQSYFDITLLFLFLSFFAFIKRLLKSGFTYKIPDNFGTIACRVNLFPKQNIFNR